MAVTLNAAVDDSAVSNDDWNIRIRTHAGKNCYHRSKNFNLSYLDVINKYGTTNLIRTTKYTLLTWLPKSLWEQFRRIANMYFLLISILMVL